MIQNKTIKKAVIILISIICIAVVSAIIYQKPEIAFFAFFIGFLLVFMSIAIKILNNRIQFLKSSSTFANKMFQSNKEELIASKEHFYSNPMYFHIFLVLLILTNLILSYFNVGTYNNTYYDQFYDDLIFQFNSAILFTIIGFLNPFLAVPESLINQIDFKNEGFLKLIANKRKLFLYRLLACILVIILFIYKNWLVFPNFLQDNLILRGVDISLLIFVLIATYRMIKYAKSFLAENVFRIIKSFSIYFGSIFVIVPLAPLTMILLTIFDIDERSFNFQPIPFIGFNLIMVYVEYSLSSKKEMVAKEESVL